MSSQNKDHKKAPKYSPEFQMNQPYINFGPMFYT